MSTESGMGLVKYCDISVVKTKISRAQPFTWHALLKKRESVLCLVV